MAYNMDPELDEFVDLQNPAISTKFFEVTCLKAFSSGSVGSVPITVLTKDIRPGDAKSEYDTEEEGRAVQSLLIKKSCQGEKQEIVDSGCDFMGDNVKRTAAKKVSTIPIKWNTIWSGLLLLLCVPSVSGELDFWAETEKRIVARDSGGGVDQAIPCKLHYGPANTDTSPVSAVWSRIGSGETQEKKIYVYVPGVAGADHPVYPADQKRYTRTGDGHDPQRFFLRIAGFTKADQGRFCCELSVPTRKKKNCTDVYYKKESSTTSVTTTVPKSPLLPTEKKSQDDNDTHGVKIVISIGFLLVIFCVVLLAKLKCRMWSSTN